MFGQKEDFTTLNVGDRVIVSSHHYEVIETITKVTKTQIHIKCTKYNRETGRQIGSDAWSSTYLHLLTPEREQEIKNKIKAENIKNYVLNHIYDATNEQLESIYNILNPKNHEVPQI